MRETGIEPAPKAPLITDRSVWSLWTRWIDRLTNAIPKVSTYTVTFDPTSVAANTTEEKTVTVNGLATTDIVFLNKPTLTAGLGIAGARVSAANTLAVTFVNATAAPIDPGSEDYLVVAIRR